MKHHTQTMQYLDKSIQEANALLRKRIKDLEEMKANSERNKVLIEKLDRIERIEKAKIKIEHGMCYTGHHEPTGEDWLIIGIDQSTKKVCVAGWPPSIADLKDITGLKKYRKRTAAEAIYIVEKFGGSFLN